MPIPRSQITYGRSHVVSARPQFTLIATWLALVGCRAPNPTSASAAPQPLPTGVAPTVTSFAAGGNQAQPVQPTPNAGSGSVQRCPEGASLALRSDGTDCGPLHCRAFTSAEDAIAYLVTKTTPLVLAVGEIHAQKDLALTASPTQRFASLLPMFCGTARHIVIELWTSRNDCGDQRVEQVRKAQRPVTQAQTSTNQNDFYELGNVAKANRIMPHALTPSCEDFQSIVAAHDRDIERMLVLTASRTADTAEALLKKRSPTGGSPYVILYGGAMHNDLTPAKGREPFSFGPRLEQSTQQRTTELDLVLREQVRDTEAYQHMAWYPHFRDETVQKRFALYQLGPRSFTLIFPSQANSQSQ